MEVTLEICVETLESALAAERGGAHRVELCSGLTEGGVTPSSGLISAVRRRLSLSLFVMIRPRGGDFCYSADEFDLMQEDVYAAKQLGADGVVLGMLNVNGEIDVVRTRHLVEIAQPLEVTFHRAFDMCRDLETSLEQVIETGAMRVLTSGGERNAEKGLAAIAKLNQVASNRLIVVAAGGIRARNIRRIVSKSVVREVHAGIRSRISSPMCYRNKKLLLGCDPVREYQRVVVPDEKVRSLLAATSQRTFATISHL
jgi:copper homeostasis protein